MRIEQNIFNCDLEKIMSVVSTFTGVSIKDIQSKKRYSDIVFARHLYFVMARRFTRCSLLNIGKYAGRADHATVIHGIDSIRNLVPVYANVRDTVSKIDNYINANMELLLIDGTGNVPPFIQTMLDKAWREGYEARDKELFTEEYKRLEAC